MNIIKFKDIIKVNDEMFNAFLKNKYAYWVRMRYIVPFEMMSQEDYVAAEGDIDLLIKTPNKGADKHYWDLYKEPELAAYIDSQATDDANTISVWQRYNKFAADPDITLEELKKFRTWLAKTLLEFDQTSSGDQKNQFYTEDFTHVLQYYANGMYDEVVKQLVVFGKTEFEVSAAASKCGCGSYDLSGLYNSTGISCEPLLIYRKNIYNAMVKAFSNPDFWSEMSTIFLTEFKQYIDNILQVGLPLVRKNILSDFVDCPCQSSSDQLAARHILENLSSTLEYLITDDLTGHKNFATDSFKAWAEQMYELMEW